ncbi:unnamed protein product [Rhodiola kirilowii]
MASSYHFASSSSSSVTTLKSRFAHHFTPPALRSYLAEFISTFFFAFTAVASSMSSSGRADSTMALVTVAIANAFALTAAVYIASSASGGHVNPAVTFGLAIGGHITIPAAIFYWIAQLTGATLACFILKAFAVSQPVPAYAIAAELSGFSASVLEGVATFALVLTVYAASDPRRIGSGSGIGAVVIGLVCGAGVLAIGPFSGGSMNPACAFGAGVASGRFRNQAVYWVGPLVGAAIGGLLYENVMFPSNENGVIEGGV